jgi:cell division septation protein DedD
MGRKRKNRTRWVLGVLLITVVLFACAPRRTGDPVVQEEPQDSLVIVQPPVQEPYPEPTIIFIEEDIPIEPEPEEEVVTQAPTFEYGFRVQILASTSEENANGFAGEARTKLDHPVYVEYIPPYYKVRVGDFIVRSDAESCRDRIRGMGYTDAFVVESLVNVP